MHGSDFFSLLPIMVYYDRGNVVPVDALIPKARAAVAAGAKYLIIPASCAAIPKSDQNEERDGEWTGFELKGEPSMYILEGDVPGLKLIPVSNIWELALAALSPKKGCIRLSEYIIFPRSHCLLC